MFSKDGSYWDDGLKRSKLLVFVAGKGHHADCGTLFEPADAPDSDEPSTWLCVEEEVGAACGPPIPWPTTHIVSVVGSLNP